MKNKVAVMQPYFLPYIGYFALISSVDTFIFFDTAQYIRRGWVNRNRIQSPHSTQGWEYFGVPIKNAPQNTLIKDIEIAEEPLWQKKNKSTLNCLFGKKINEEPYSTLLEPLFNPCSKLSDLNCQLIKRMAEFLDLKTQFLWTSHMGITKSEGATAEDYIISLCQKVECGEYWNLPGGKELYSYANFEKQNIKLRFLPSLNLIDPEPSLSFSILDFLLSHGKVKAQKIIQEIVSGVS